MTNYHTKILFLTLKTFSLTGGIEKACRSLMKTINDLGYPLDTWSMYDGTADNEERYTPNECFKGFSGHKISFTWAVLTKAFHYDKVILSHINLLLFGLIIKKLKPKTKIILWAHGIEVWREIPNWKKEFLQKYAEIWAVSSFTKQKLIDCHHIDASKIKILHNTLDPFFNVQKDFKKPGYLIEKYKMQTNSFVLFSLTRLSATEHRKNYDTVMSAVKQLHKQLPNLVYLIGGKADLEEQNRLQHYIDENELQEQIKLIGFIEETEITDHFALADCFILPSEKEGFGIVFIEAAACGCQVIGGNVDGSTDALLNGNLGQLINPSNENEIKAAIKRAIGNTHHQKQQQQEMALANFGFETYVEKVKGLLAVGVQ